MSVLLEAEPAPEDLLGGLPPRDHPQLDVRQLPLEDMTLVMEMKSGRMTGRQAQMRATVGSAVDQTANWIMPLLKTLGDARLAARAMETATPL